MIQENLYSRRKKCRFVTNLISLLLCFLFYLAPTAIAQSQSQRRLPEHWWESVSAIRNVTLKDDNAYPQLSLQKEMAERQLRGFQEQGFAGIQVFAPADGGKSYDGLDTRDHFRIEPKYGSIEDFKSVVGIAHGLGMPVIIFVNLGYSGLDAPSFLKACDDVREGRESKESKWFFWSDSSDAPAPATGNTYFMVRPTWLSGYQPTKTEHWVYSQRARHYYWTRWPGKDAQGNRIDLPQYNWLSEEWQQEVAAIVRFWMDTGIDGMVVDAVNWYVGYTWDKGHKLITDIISSYGNKYSQPEGGGGFHEDPAAWITEGGWASVQDYGLNLWWEKQNVVLKNAVENGDPRPIEQSLRQYHDRVVSAGGTLNMTFPKLDSTAKQHLAAAIVATTGQLITDWSSKDENIASDPEIQWLLKTKAAHRALFQTAPRQKLPTNDEAKDYAFIRSTVDRTERVLVVTNFDAVSRNVVVDMSAVNAKQLKDVKTGETIQLTNPLVISSSGYGYRLFLLE
jgi:Alpha amylase, catalytic domain